MYFSRPCTAFLLFCISFYFGSVAGFNLTEAIEEVTEVLKFTYGLLGFSSINVTSISNAGSLKALTEAADDFITQEELDKLKEMAKNPDKAESMSTAFFNYKRSFAKLLEADPSTKNEEIPLTMDIASIATVWEAEKGGLKED